MKKQIFALLLIFSFTPAIADELVSCTVTKILNNSILDESLSIEEYPDVSVERKKGLLVAYLGASLFGDDTPAEHTIELVNEPSGKLTVYKITNIEYKEMFFIKVKDKTGTVEYQATPQSKKIILAKLSCK